MKWSPSMALRDYNRGNHYRRWSLFHGKRYKKNRDKRYGVCQSREWILWHLGSGPGLEETLRDHWLQPSKHLGSSNLKHLAWERLGATQLKSPIPSPNPEEMKELEQIQLPCIYENKTSNILKERQEVSIDPKLWFYLPIASVMADSFTLNPNGTEDMLNHLRNGQLPRSPDTKGCLHHT